MNDSTIILCLLAFLLLYIWKSVGNNLGINRKKVCDGIEEALKTSIGDNQNLETTLNINGKTSVHYAKSNSSGVSLHKITLSGENICMLTGLANVIRFNIHGLIKRAKTQQPEEIFITHNQTGVQVFFSLDEEQQNGLKDFFAHRQ